MKKDYYEFHSEFCKTFTNPKRIEILDLLRGREMTVTDIQKKVGVAKAHASLMLSVMRMKNILKARREGQNIYYSIANTKIEQACGELHDAFVQLMRGMATERSIKGRRSP